MSISTFKEFNGERPVSINSEFVVCYYPDPDNEELMTIELVNGSKFTVVTQEKVLTNWLTKSATAGR